MDIRKKLFLQLSFQRAKTGRSEKFLSVAISITDPITSQIFRMIKKAKKRMQKQMEKIASSKKRRLLFILISRAINDFEKRSSYLIVSELPGKTVFLLKTLITDNK